MTFLLTLRRTLPAVCLTAVMVISCLAQADKIAQPAAAANTPSHLSNFAKVSDNYYRGAQPDDEALKEIAAKGVRTIVDLRGEDKGRTDHERETTKSLGMQYISLPLSSVSAPSDQQVEKFLSIIHNQTNQPVFVHCLRGSDRTGVMTAIVRMNDFEWTADQAYGEMKEHGFRSFLLPSMKHYVYKYADKRPTH